MRNVDCGKINSMQNAAKNPSIPFTCRWNDYNIFRATRSVMSIPTPSLLHLIGCYSSMICLANYLVN